MSQTKFKVQSFDGVYPEYNRGAQDKSLKFKVNEHLGFTLMEMLVVVSVLGLIVVAISGIFLASVQSSSKAEVTKEVRHNGEYALSVIQGMILSSKSVSCPVPGGDQIVVRDTQGYITNFVCTEASGVNSGKIASNSSDLTYGVSISNCRFTCLVTAGKPTKVTIDFTVSQYSTVTLRPGEKSQIRFYTEVVARNSN